MNEPVRLVKVGVKLLAHRNGLFAGFCACFDVGNGLVGGDSGRRVERGEVAVIGRRRDGDRKAGEQRLVAIPRMTMESSTSMSVSPVSENLVRSSPFPRRHLEAARSTKLVGRLTRAPRGRSPGSPHPSG